MPQGTAIARHLPILLGEFALQLERESPKDGALGALHNFARLKKYSARFPAAFRRRAGQGGSF